MTAFAALVRKDLQLFFGDRRAVILAVVTPVVIASFFGFLFSGDNSASASRTRVCVVDLDGSALSAKIVSALTADSALEVVSMKDAISAREAVRKGGANGVPVAVIVPVRFGEAASRAFFGMAAKPELELLYDPSRTTESAMVRGILTQHVMEAVSAEVFSGATGTKVTEEALDEVGRTNTLPPEDKRSLLRLLGSVREWQGRQTAARDKGTALPAGGITMPYNVKQEAVTAGRAVPYNSYAHSYAGMGIQFILFAAIELGMGILLERQQGLWRRLRAAPISKGTLLGAKATSGALIAFTALAATFAVGMLVFRIRVLGTWTGFLLIGAASALMVAAFGLMLAALGRTTGATRGIAIMAVLLMTMLGGGWVPAFLFPGWMRTLTLAIPVRWAVDGLDAVTWRGVGLGGALPAVGILLGFTLLFGAVAVWRFRWQEE
jgi:ABC-2 type transport system permease protein